MYDEEEDWELPVVLVDSSADDSTTFEMPPAEEIVERRAKELACKQELQRLRELEEGDEAGASSAAPENLATELSMLLALPQLPRPGAAQLWAALAPHVPGAPTLQAGLLEAQMPRIVRSLAAGVKSAARWTDADMLGACALLTVAVLMENSPNRRQALRTLHALLDRYANREQLTAVAYMMVNAFPADSAQRLELGEKVCSGSMSGGDRVSYILNSTAVLDLLGAGGRCCEPSAAQVARAAAAWRRCAAPAQARVLQFAGRLLGGGTPSDHEERALLLDNLRPDPVAAGDVPQKERLKVLIEASKLRLLFVNHL